MGKQKSREKAGDEDGMKKNMMVLSATLALLLVFGGCSRQNGAEYARTENIADSFPVLAEPETENPQMVQSEGPYAILHTTAGDITILLYPEQAPKAVENFIRLAEEGYYDGSCFFYIKKDELAQAGKPKAKEGSKTPEGEPQIYGEERSIWKEPFEDEFDDGLHNFAGAIGMAGDGRDHNLSQFYLTVSEKKPEDERVVSASMYINELVRKTEQEMEEKGSRAPLKQEEVQAFEDDLNSRIQKINTEGIPEKYMQRYRPAVERYQEVGGSWGLDYKQTVFGQIVKGLNVARAITRVKVDPSSREPKQELVIKKITIRETLEGT